MNTLPRSFAALTLVLFAASPASADDGEAKQAPGDVSSSSGSGMAAPLAPACNISSPSRSWKVPVGAGIPVHVNESSGAKLDATASLSPAAEYTLLADKDTARPEYYRVLKIAGAKAGDIFNVTLGGTCTGAPQATAATFEMTVEFTAEQPLPTALGTLKEEPQGLTLLTLDPSFVPYRQTSTLDFTRDGASLGTYNMALPPSLGDRFGVRACVDNACTPPPGADLAANQPLNLSAALVCTNGRASGVVEVKLSAQAHIPGAATQPAAVAGTIHVDCTKATDTELGKTSPPSTPNTVGTSPGTGCSAGGTGSQGGLAGLAFLLFAFAKKRRQSRA